MRNRYLDEKTRSDIDQRIDRIHKDLGRADRPVDLGEVRALLKLDIGYYKADDPHLVREVVHSLKLGAKRVVEAPRLLMDTIRKFDLRALLLWQPRRILIDNSLHDLKKRWSEAHEVSHSVIPWHEHYSLGDDQSTLSPGCHEQIEAEANYGAGRLLFPPQRFLEVSASAPPSLDYIRSIAKDFGNSITTTLWRFVENAPGLAFGLVSQHPYYVDSTQPAIDHLILSRRMTAEFPKVDGAEIFAALGEYCSRARGGPLGSGEAILIDTNHETHVFTLSSFANTHRVLTLGIASG